MRVVTIVGARPQFVKAAAVSRAIRASGAADEVLVHTGQHYDEAMSAVFFAELDIAPPKVNLGVGSGTHGTQTGRILEGIERVLLDERPDAVLVYGDTNSTLAGALAAAKLHIPVAHVEAGLRSFNRRMPEEVNRVLADHASDLLLAPTRAAVDNLRAEGINPSRIQQVGDVMYDAALHYLALAERTSSVLARLDLSTKGYALATVHRAENTDDPRRLGAILDALGALARELPVLLPLHPRTRDAAKRAGLALERPGLRMIDPVGYLDMVILERDARLIVTDSGGVQKEAYFHGVPCATLRDETEWVELIETGWNRLVPPGDPEAMAHALRAALLGAEHTLERPALYGEGDAARHVVRALLALR